MAVTSHIRWDRVGRVALLCVLFGLVVLYVRPIASYLQAHSQAAEKRQEVLTLERQHARLEAQVRALRRPDTLEMEARKLGYVRQGERPYVIEGLPGGP